MADLMEKLRENYEKHGPAREEPKHRWKANLNEIPTRHATPVRGWEGAFDTALSQLMEQAKLATERHFPRVLQMEGQVSDIMRTVSHIHDRIGAHDAEFVSLKAAVQFLTDKLAGKNAEPIANEGSIENRFRTLADAWQADCAFMSSITDMSMIRRISRLLVWERGGSAAAPRIGKRPQPMVLGVEEYYRRRSSPRILSRIHAGNGPALD